MIRKLRRTCVCISLICGVLTFGIAGLSWAALDAETGHKATISKVVARVNGQPIYEDALAPYVQREMKKFKKYGAKQDTSSLEMRLKRKALDEVIAIELIKQESRKIQVKDVERKINERYSEVKKKYHSEDQFRSFLAARGRTENDVKRSIESKIYVDEYLKQKGIKDPVVPEEEIRTYYEEHKKSFQRQEFIQASHILIAVKDDATPEDKDKARQKAENIRKEIMEGKDFAEAAKEYSEDGHAPEGGALGYIKRGFMPPEFDKAAFSLKVGELSEIVQTKHGYHIIKVLDRKPEGVAPYEDVKDFIGKYLQGELAQKKRASHIMELKNKATIEILLNNS